MSLSCSWRVGYLQIFWDQSKFKLESHSKLGVEMLGRGKEWAIRLLQSDLGLGP